MQLETCLYLSYWDKSAIFSSSSTLKMYHVCRKYALKLRIFSYHTSYRQLTLWYKDITLQHSTISYVNVQASASSVCSEYYLVISSPHFVKLALQNLGIAWKITATKETVPVVSRVSLPCWLYDKLKKAKTAGWQYSNIIVPFLWSVRLIKRDLTLQSLGPWRLPVVLTLHMCQFRFT